MNHIENLPSISWTTLKTYHPYHEPHWKLFTYSITFFFAAKWLEELEIAAPNPVIFKWTLKSNEIVEVERLWTEGKFKFASNDNFPGVSYAELPYLGQELSFGIILPEKYNGIDELDQNVSIDMYETFISKAKYQKDTRTSPAMVLSMPKFKIETTCNLKEALQNLGMMNLFEGSANFSAISASDDLQVSDIVHKTFVIVDEEGTEAAAATVEEIIMCDPPHFGAGHPFIFFIKDSVTRSILFMGRLMNPNEN